MIRRSRLAAAMEILAALKEGPSNSTRLAQRCNINYGRLDKDLKPLHTLGWISRGVSDGHEIHMITGEGLKAYARYITLWNEWQRGLKLTSGQEGFLASER